MKLVVQKIIILVIICSNIANLTNLRSKNPQFNMTNIDNESSNLIKVNKNFDHPDLIPDEKLENINFDYVLFNLNIIEQKIDEFKSKLGGKFFN
jgi:hypothetical protein